VDAHSTGSRADDVARKTGHHAGDEIGKEDVRRSDVVEGLHESRDRDTLEDVDEEQGQSGNEQQSEETGDDGDLPATAELRICPGEGQFSWVPVARARQLEAVVEYVGGAAARC